MIDLDIISALVFMPHIIDLDAYEFQQGMKKSSTTFLMNARVLHYTYDKGSLSYKNIIVYLC